MSYVTAAILLVLSTLQLPRPAAPVATVVSEDESLRGISAMSVTVQVQGKLIDAAATKADIETKLRQRGIGVLNRGLPRLHLQVDYVPTSDGRSTYAVFAMRLELAQALARPSGAGLVEAVTWSNGSFGILGDGVTEKLDARASSMVNEFLGALLSVNAGLAKAAGASGLGVKQTILTVNRSHIGSFARLRRDTEDVVLKQLEQLIAQRQQVVSCSYGPSNKAEGTGFVVYDFWYKAPPAQLLEMMKVSSPETHPFEELGRQAVDGCPETPEVARRVWQRMRP